MAGQLTCMGEIGPGENKSLRRPRYRWKDKIKMVLT
jgi:hypothetical protein